MSPPLLLLLLSLSMFSCLFSSSLSSSANFELTILHTNDMHSRFEQADVYGNVCTDALAKAKKCYGGFARLKTAVTRFKEEAAKENLPILFLNAGDTFQGTPYYSTYRWKIAANLVPKLGIDVMNIGNHEFNAGIEELVSYLKKIPNPVVVANADYSGEPSLKKIANLTPSKILEIANVKIGIIGYTLPLKKSSTRNVEFLDEITTVRHEAKRLKSQNVSIIIGLGHSGFDMDIEVAKNVPEISMIVGGHSHTFLYNPKDKKPSVDEVTAEYPYIVTQESGRCVPIVHAFCNTKYLGVVKVKFDENGEALSAVGNPVLLDDAFEEDEAILKDVLSYKPGLERILNKLTGKTNVLLTDRITADAPESNFGNLITDAFVNYAAEQFEGKSGWTDAPIGLLQGGSIRANIDRKEDKGVITYGDVMTALPMDSGLIKMNISGSTLLKALEYSVEKVHRRNSRLFIENHLHVSGIKLVYDLTKPVGYRVRSVHIRCAKCRIPSYEPLQPARIYTIVISDFLSHGGNGFKMFADENHGFRSLGVSCRQIVAEYLTTQEVVYPAIEGRIIIQNYSSTMIASAAVTNIPIGIYLIISPLLFITLYV